jgi:hypothetical protein
MLFKILDDYSAYVVEFWDVLEILCLAKSYDFNKIELHIVQIIWCLKVCHMYPETNSCTDVCFMSNLRLILSLYILRILFEFCIFVMFYSNIIFWFSLSFIPFFFYFWNDYQQFFVSYDLVNKSYITKLTLNILFEIT